LSENPIYFRPQDWRDLDGLIDWIIEQNKAGYQMVNSVQRLEEMTTLVRMSSGLNIRQVGWFGDGNGSDAETAEMLQKAGGLCNAKERTENWASANGTAVPGRIM
jgi:hypothetical protein